MGIQKRSIIICADDYGLNHSVNDGIIKLVAAKRLSAVSCMTNSPIWLPAAERLKSYLNKVNVGLHFNLSHDFGNNKFKSLNSLIVECLLRRADKQWIIEELNTQLDYFEQAFGCPPDFIDGHHHVHIFPQIRQVLFDVLEARYGSDKKIWLRRVNPKLVQHDAQLKAILLRILAYNFERAATAAKYQLSGNFAGLYSLRFKADYETLMKKWLLDSEDQTLIMCHPGLYSEGQYQDESDRVRNKEYIFLQSTEFASMLAVNNIAIDKLNIS